MKLGVILAAAIVSGAALAAVPSFGQAQPPATSQVAAPQDVQALRSALQAFRTAVRTGDGAAAKAALLQIKTDWTALPPATRERIQANHPDLVARLAAMKAVPQDIQALRGAIADFRTARATGDAAAAKSAFSQIRADWKALPPAIKLLIVDSHPNLAQRLRAWRNRTPATTPGATKPA